jgi:hypothetical protein
MSETNEGTDQLGKREAEKGFNSNTGLALLFAAFSRNE